MRVIYIAVETAVEIASLVNGSKLDDGNDEKDDNKLQDKRSLFLRR